MPMPQPPVVGMPISRPDASSDQIVGVPRQHLGDMRAAPDVAVREAAAGPRRGRTSATLEVLNCSAQAARRGARGELQHGLGDVTAGCVVPSERVA